MVSKYELAKRFYENEVYDSAISVCMKALIANPLDLEPWEVLTDPLIAQDSDEISKCLDTKIELLKSKKLSLESLDSLFSEK